MNFPLQLKKGKNMNLRARIKVWIPVFLYMLLIFYMSSLEAKELPAVQIDLSPIHILEFFILSYLVFRAISNEKLKTLHIFILTILISTMYGIIDEMHQLFVPGRYFSIFDIIFNFIGSSLILFKFWKK